MIKRIVLGVLGLVVLIAALGGGAVGLFVWRFFPQIPDAEYDPPANISEARLQDLDYLSLLPDIDKSFSEAERAAFGTRLEEISQRVDAMSETRFLMEVASAVAITDNGHTNVRLRSLLEAGNSLPVRFFWFGDGLHIVRARAEQADLIGARVVRYGGQTPADITQALNAYKGGNDAFVRHDGAMFFSSPSLIHAIGLIPDADTVALELVLPSGEVQTVQLDIEAEPTGPIWISSYLKSELGDAERDSGHDWRFLRSEITQAGWYGRNPDQLLWSEPLDHGGLIIRMRNVFGDEATPLPGWLEAEAQRLRASPAEFLILDLRGNGGGDYTRTMSVARELDQLVTEDGRIYVLTDGGTFSAAIVTAAFALYSGGERALLVGEAMGDDAQFWAEGGAAMRLPNSDLPIFVSTAYHDWENGCDDWSRCYWLNIGFGVAAGPLDVDLPAPMLFSDYAQGIDSGVEAILAAEAARQ